MRYRHLWWLLPILLLLTACAIQPENARTDPVDFYYCSAQQTYGDSTGTLAVESHQQADGEEDIDGLLSRYLQGPQTEGLRSPFPKDLQIEDWALRSGVLTVVLNDRWLSLSGQDKTVAQACLVYTVTQLPEVNAVKIFCEEAENGVLLSRESFLLYDDSATSDQVTVKLYFSDSKGRYLVEERRSRSFRFEDEIPAYIIDQLLAGPQNSSSLAVLPEGTNLLQVGVVQGLCTVDFSEAFLTNRPMTHAGARLTVFSVVNALTELPEVERVRFLCVGQPIGDYSGLDLSGTFFREEPALGQGQDASAKDVTLYVPCGKGGELAAVPTYVRQSAGRTEADAVLDALLDFTPANGYEDPIPAGTAVVELKTHDGLCQVTLSSAFAQADEDPRQARLAVRSVVATLCAMEEIDRVQISVHDGSLTSVDLSQPMQPESGWLLP